MGKQLYFEKKCRCPFCAYVQVHDDRNVNNLMVDRTQGAICLGPTGKLQGSYVFLLLRTGREITWSQFTELPTLPHITRRVISMTMHEKQKNRLVFEDRNALELPMIDEDGPSDGAGATGVDIGNIANQPNLGVKTYRDIANDDDYDNTADNTDIEIVSAPAAIPKIIIDVDEESTGVADGENID